MTSSTAALWVFLASSAILVAGCDDEPRSCNLLAAPDVLEVRFYPGAAESVTEGWSEETLRAEVALPDRVIVMTTADEIEIRDLDGEPWPTEPIGGGGQWESDDYQLVFLLSENREYASFILSQFSGPGPMPAQVGITLEQGERTLLVDELEPQYEMSEPNGPGCGFRYSARFDLENVDDV